MAPVDPAFTDDVTAALGQDAMTKQTILGNHVGVSFCRHISSVTSSICHLGPCESPLRHLAADPESQYTTSFSLYSGFWNGQIAKSYSVLSASGLNLTVTQNGTDSYVTSSNGGSAKILRSDILLNNGVMHVSRGFSSASTTCYLSPMGCLLDSIKGLAVMLTFLSSSSTRSFTAHLRPQRQFRVSLAQLPRRLDWERSARGQSAMIFRHLPHRAEHRLRLLKSQGFQASRRL